MGLYTRALPDFPWDSLEPYRARAAAHPDGIVDLSVGTPVDPTPPVVTRALRAAADAPGYPTTAGPLRLRRAVVEFLVREHGTIALEPGAVLPTIGSKEMVAGLPAWLGLGPGDVVVHPATAYPTYDVGARLVGARPVACDDPAEVRPEVGERIALVWVNSPANPTGHVLEASELARVVAWARAHDAVVASDECYAALGWGRWEETAVPSVLDPQVCDGRPEGLLALYSLSKQSNMAGYRAAWVAGDRALVSRLLEVRKHAGMMVPEPVQRAMVAALEDAGHVAEQKARYRARRERLAQALDGAGYVVDDSEAGLYLWTRRPGVADCWSLVAELAESGILVAPGAFYGPRGTSHVRIALTGTDERIEAATGRLGRQ